nr:IS3 family transposase [Mucilaginibacter sp. 21P]
MKKRVKDEQRRNQRDYSLAFKLQVVQQVEKGEFTYKKTQKHYGIQGRSTVLVWLRKHGTLDWTLPKQYTLNNDKEPTPEQRIKQLEAALKDEQDKNVIYKTMFEILKNEHGIALKKVFTQAIQRLKAKGIVSLSKACRLFGISRQGYYQKQQRIQKRIQELSQVKAEVIKERIHLPRLSTRKLYYRLDEKIRSRGIKIGRDALFDFLRSEHMLIRPKHSYHKTTNSKHWLHKYPNLLKNRKAATRPNEIWVSDITYIDTKAETAYLSLITDAYSRKIVGYHLHPSLHTDGVAAAMQMAVKHEQINAPLIHHYRGLQYCSAQYQKLFAKYHITPSMTDGYDCNQNALAERINGIIKNELLVIKPADIRQAKTMIEEAVGLYNYRQPHLALNYQTPQTVHQQKVLAEIEQQGLSLSY